MVVAAARWLGAWCFACVLTGASAATYEFPADGNDIVGTEHWVTASHEDTLLDLALANGVGYDEIRLANPQVDPWLPGAGTAVLLPTRYVLPHPRNGIVVNLAEMRLYYFPKKRVDGRRQVMTFPVSIGGERFETPLGETRVVEKLENPTWYPGPDVQAERREEGLEPLPRAVPPGPDNPLGPLALKLGIPEILIHGTNKPMGIGMSVTHGCMRMAAEHLRELFQAVPRGTHVRIVDERYKLGWQNGVLYVEAHPDRAQTALAEFRRVEPLLRRVARQRPNYEPDWVSAEALLLQPRGVPRPLWRAQPSRS